MGLNLICGNHPPAALLGRWTRQSLWQHSGPGEALSVMVLHLVIRNIFQTDESLKIYKLPRTRSSSFSQGCGILSRGASLIISMRSNQTITLLSILFQLNWRISSHGFHYLHFNMAQNQCAALGPAERCIWECVDLSPIANCKFPLFPLVGKKCGSNLSNVVAKQAHNKQ